MTGSAFCRYTDKTSLLSAIDNVKYPGGEYTDLLSALQIITGVFSILQGDRLGVQNILILITDGAPEYPDIAYGVESVVVQLVGVGMFVVCDKPDCTAHHAKVIASPPQKVRYYY